MTDQAPQHETLLRKLATRLTLPALALAALVAVTPGRKAKAAA